MSGKAGKLTGVALVLVAVGFLGCPVRVDGFGVSFLACTLDVVCGTAQNATIGNLTVHVAFWPIIWIPTYLGGDPNDPTLYMTIDPNTGVISRNALYPSFFTQQIWKIDGIDASLSLNMVSAYMIVKWPECGPG